MALKPLRLTIAPTGAGASVFQAYLDCEDDVAAADILEALSRDHVAPLLQRAVEVRLSRHRQAHRIHAEDIASDAMVAFLMRAETMRDGTAQEPIGNFPAFITMLGNRACSHYFRRAYPGFYRTGNKLKYLLDKSVRLVRFDDGKGNVVCGLSAWKKDRMCAKPDMLQGLADLSTIKNAEEMVVVLFQRIGAPLQFYDLVSVVARIWNVVDTPVPLEDLPQSEPGVSSPDVAEGQSKWLAELWREIQNLNSNQRRALLLNLRDEQGHCAVSLFVATGVASVVQIANAAEIALMEFAAMWKRLPLSDMEIADGMGISRQQVINLRKCARERLTRRMAKISRRNGNVGAL